jgi:transcriptional regulatory protein RtcR
MPDPAGTWNAIDLNLSRYDSIARRFAEAQEDSATLLKSGIATRNAAFNRMIAEIERVATRSAAPMLLMGPTGAGKSQLARRIYELKASRHRLSGPFVEVNCATLKGDGAMSALFGHRKGAFTGAMTERAGLLRSADGGMLFLDEIGELGLDEQAMILRAVEEGRFLPLGADKEVTSRFQLIAGTNRELLAEVTAGRFREDLFARLNLWTFRLPSLAERPEDIEPNLDYEMDRFAAARTCASPSTRKRAKPILRSPPARRRHGRATSATSPPASPAWRRWPPLVASIATPSIRKLRASGSYGRTAHRRNLTSWQRC